MNTTIRVMCSAIALVIPLNAITAEEINSDPKVDLVSEYPVHDAGNGHWQHSPILDPIDSCCGLVDFPARVGMRHQTGQGIGYEESFTTLEGFVPYRPRANTLGFVNVRGVLSNNGPLGSNLGAGFRRYDCCRNRIFGANIYYDYRDTGTAGFNQIGFGFESLGEVLDSRLNVYLPIGPQCKVRSQSSSEELWGNQRFAVVQSPTMGSVPGIVGDLIRRDTLFQDVEAAMKGFDWEIGGDFIRDTLRAYVGVYHYQSECTPQAWGVQARAEAIINRSVSVNLAVSEDRVFDTNLVLQVALYLPGPRAFFRNARRYEHARLDEPVWRNHNIVVSQASTSSVTETILNSNQVAVQPNTDEPVQVWHASNVVNGVADPTLGMGGDGSFANPFQTLDQLDNVTGQAILLIHAGTVFDGTQQSANSNGIAVESNQRLLGDNGLASCPRLVTADCGVGGPTLTINLPRANSLTARPIIRDSQGAASSMVQGPNTNADNIEISGLHLIDATQGTNRGIRLQQASSFTICGNIIDGFDQNAIDAGADGGVNIIARNEILNNGNTGGGFDGVNVDLAGNETPTLSFENNIMRNNGLSGDFGASFRISGSNTTCMRAIGNDSDNGYELVQQGMSVFNMEENFDDPGVNIGTFTEVGTITQVGVGFCNLPSPIP